MATPPKILIVDDTITNLGILKKTLKEFDIIEATDGRTALKLVNAAQPDLILLDILMPGIDGHSVLSILKNNERTRNIPVILISSLDGIEDKIRSFDKGADDFITKPFNPQEVKARIYALLRVKVLQDEIARIPRTLASLVDRIEARNALTAGHGLRTAFYAEQLAKKISHQKTDHDRMRIAAALHDIGYLEINDAIRQNAGPLTAEERALIKLHPVHSTALCSVWPGMKFLLPWIKHHHEHFDGLGYPDGITGTNIPIGARILAIADAFDALTTARPYRKTNTQAEALVILLENAGTQWDPEYVALFCELADGTDLRAAAEKFQLANQADIYSAALGASAL